MRKPKPIQLTMEPWPDPKPGRLYRGRVTQVTAKKESISVTVEHLDKTMAGRLDYAELPKCLHPGNKTHRFASAARLDAQTLGEQIDLRQAVGRTIGMRFLPVGDGYEIEFERLPEPRRDDSDSIPNGKQSLPQIDASVPEMDESKWQL